MSKFRNLLMSMKGKVKQRLKASDYIKGIRSGDRIVLSRAITLIESSLPADRTLAQTIIEKLLSATGRSLRIGITGAPGVGKSTFIEAFGKFLTSQNKKVAVLAVDPSSQKTKGSILGDKTRMDELSKDALAYVRPSATGSSLGGVAQRTRETILLCEAAGYEIVLIETVGVGQSETEVRNMTDFFLLLMLSGAGDELQGIKKGIMEMADGIVITKSDGDNIKRARQAQADYQHALHLFQPSESEVTPKVLLASAQEKKGMKEIWRSIEEFQLKTQSNGFFKRQREQQNLLWFQTHFHQMLLHRVMNHKNIEQLIQVMKQKISHAEISPFHAADLLIKKIK